MPHTIVKVVLSAGKSDKKSETSKFIIGSGEAKKGHNKID